MSEEKFLEKMADILDMEAGITMDTKLQDLEEWDSLSIVSYISMVNTECDKRVAVKEVREAESIRDLYCLL